jgi:hypothetical protein
MMMIMSAGTICMYTMGGVDEQGDNDNNAKTMKNDAR